MNEDENDDLITYYRLHREEIDLRAVDGEEGYDWIYYPLLPFITIYNS